jgi:2-polyprenyl-3-methyl-5-hydroxy-6-metoxy-1,4-benzoquinol methylase
VALGLFIGCLPLYGLHLPLCVGACLLFRLDAVVAYLAANISNPLVAPFLLTAEVEVGSLLLTGEHAAFDVEQARSVGVAGFAAQASVGSVVVGAGLALIGGTLAYVLAPRRRRRSPELLAAIERTLGRYAGAKLSDLQYVRGKLYYDPVLESIASLGTELGDTIDAGAGRGQLSLCLLELGKVKRLTGFDLDERKIALARRAGGDDATFAVVDLAQAELEPADTILLVDVLHYLPQREQDELLERAARNLRPGGRLLVRDANRRAGASSLLTRALERLASATGWHRSRSKLCFRSADELVGTLERAGLTCQTQGAAQGTPFDNVLIVAARAAQAASGAPSA